MLRNPASASASDNSLRPKGLYESLCRRVVTPPSCESKTRTNSTLCGLERSVGVSQTRIGRHLTSPLLTKALGTSTVHPGFRSASQSLLSSMSQPPGCSTERMAARAEAIPPAPFARTIELPTHRTPEYCL